MSEFNPRTHTLIKGRWYKNATPNEPFKVQGRAVIDLHLWICDDGLYWLSHIVREYQDYKRVSEDFFKRKFVSEKYIVYASSNNIEPSELETYVNFVKDAVESGSQKRYRLD